MEEVKPTSVNPVIESPQENPPSVTIEAKVDTEVKTYTRYEEAISPPKERASSDTTIFRGALMITNLCFGVTIFTFAIRTSYFGLCWLIVTGAIVGLITYWTIMRGIIASSKCVEDDFSELTEKLLGGKTRFFLNVIIIVYTYAVMMMFMALIYSLFGRFIYSSGFTKKYSDYENFEDEIWQKAYVKFPVYVGLTLGLCFMCLIRDMDKLNFSAYIGVFSVIYSLFVVLVQCHDYNKDSKTRYYIESDENTHANWFNIKKAFTKDLEFFKGVAALFTANACHPGVFPIFVGFKYQKDGLKKMRYATIIGVLTITLLYILSMIISFVTNPYQPEDVIIYRKSKGGKDIAMTIAKLMVTLSIIFTYPGTYFSLRLSIANSFTKGHISTKFNIILTFVSCYICSAVASIYDKILNYLSYIGGFLTVFMCYLIPILMYIKTSGKPMTYWKNLLELIGAIFLCVVGFVGGIVTIIDDAT